MVWILLALAYFFPGVAKLWESGDLWISGVKLKVELFDKWANLENFKPLLRIDQSDVALMLLGAFTLIFEIGILFAVFFSRWRILAAFQAVAFHAGIATVMGIRFKVGLPVILLFDTSSSLASFPVLRRVCVVARKVEEKLIRDVNAVLRLDRRWPLNPQMTGRPSRRAACAVGVLLILGMIFTGVREIDSQPVSIFPRFSHRTTIVPISGSGLDFRLLRGARELALPELSRIGPARTTRLFFTFYRAYNAGDRAAVDMFLPVYVRVLTTSGVDIQEGDRLRVYQRTWPADPDLRTADRIQSELILEVPLVDSMNGYG